MLIAPIRLRRLHSWRQKKNDVISSYITTVSRDILFRPLQKMQIKEGTRQATKGRRNVCVCVCVYVLNAVVAGGTDDATVGYM